MNLVSADTGAFYFMKRASEIVQQQLFKKVDCAELYKMPLEVEV